MRFLVDSAGAGRQCAPASPGRRGCPALNFTVRCQLHAQLIDSHLTLEVL
jgi:hypothetical protein